MLVRGQKKALFQSSFQVRRTLPSSLLMLLFEKAASQSANPDLSPKTQAFGGGALSKSIF
jgi:hypothetical protein